MIYYEGRENMFDSDELGFILENRSSVIGQFRDKTGDDDIRIEDIKFVGIDEVTNEYVYEYKSHQAVIDSFDKKLPQYIEDVISKTEENLELLKKKCKGCMKGNYMTCNYATNPRCLKGSIEETEEQLERLRTIPEYIADHPGKLYTTDYSRSMYTEVYIKSDCKTERGYEARYNIQKEIWEVSEAEFITYSMVGITSGVSRKLSYFHHDKFSGNTSIVKSTDKEQVQMTVDWLNTGYTIICRNCGKITFFDKEYINELKSAGRNMPVRCCACKEKLVKKYN